MDTVRVLTAIAFWHMSPLVKWRNTPECKENDQAEMTEFCGTAEIVSLIEKMSASDEGLTSWFAVASEQERIARGREIIMRY